MRTRVRLSSVASRCLVDADEPGLPGSGPATTLMHEVNAILDLDRETPDESRGRRSEVDILNRETMTLTPGTPTDAPGIDNHQPIRGIEMDDIEVARSTATEAARSAGVSVRTLETLEEIEQAVTILSRVWARDEGNDIMPLELLRALTHAGNYAAGAFTDDDSDSTMVGAIAGFLGRHERRVVLHSHIAGMLPASRSRGGGYALKQHQRAWALHHGIGTITWTFDPLVRRNAYFNLTKLGATAVAYHTNFYGVMNDAINAGGQTDRLMVAWSLVSSEKSAAGAERRGRPVSDDTAVLLDSDDRGAPVVRDHVRDGERALRCHIPEEIVAVRRGDPEVAQTWRRALRTTLGTAIDDGYVATTMTRDGWYLLERGPRTGSAA